MALKVWSDFVRDWEKIPIDGYKLLFQRGIDRFEETISECESITDKAIKLLTAVILAIPYFIAYNFCNLNISHCFSVPFMLIYMANVTILIILIFPRDMRLRGSPPEEIYNTSIEPPDNSDFTDDERVKVIYRQELIRLNDNIEHNKYVNRRRIRLFKASLIIAAIIFTIGITARFICLPLS